MGTEITLMYSLPVKF